MCNLYTNARSKDELARLFNVQMPFDLPEVESHIHPKRTGHIIRKQDGARIVDAKTWGIPNR